MSRWLPIGLLVFAPALIGCNGDAPKNEGDKGQKVARNEGKKIPQANEGPVEAAQVEPDFKLTAEAMVKEFMADPKGAEAKYKDKIVEVTGEVYLVMEKHEFHLNGVKLKEDDIFAFCVRCGVWRRDFDQVQRVSQLSEGQKVKFVGKFTHLGFDRCITIPLGKLTELEPSEIVATTAEEIARAFETDEEAAKSKYKMGRMASNVIVSGKIGRLLEMDGFHIAQLTGSAKTHVRICLTPEDFKGLQEGQEVQYRGVHVVYDRQTNEVGLDGGMLLRPLVTIPLP